MCALVLEDNPVGADSRLSFESFPESGFDEAYSVAGYREIAADRMPQPGFAAYRGGNWNNFSLDLKFRANRFTGRHVTVGEMTPAELGAILLQMERKVRWCQALSFPLERDAKTFQERVQSKPIFGGMNKSDMSTVSLGQLTRNDPPLVLVVFGSFLTLRCYCTGYTIKWEHPFHPVTAQPYGATVSLQFLRLDKEYPTWESIRNQAGGSPQAPAFTGNVNFTSSNQASARTQNDSAAAEASARSSDPGGAAAQFLSVGSS